MLIAEKYSMEKLNQKTRIGIEKKTRLRWKRTALIKIVGVVIGLVFLNSVIQALVVEKNYQITVQQGKIQALDRELNKIQIEIAGLNSYERIQNLAKTELGMKLASPGDYRRIAVAPSVNQTAPRSYEKNIWSRVAAWVGSAGETLANTP
ncbi:MAG: hypothetical protein ACM3YE_17555 [Bacteroidota bacterium]